MKLSNIVAGVGAFVALSAINAQAQDSFTKTYYWPSKAAAQRSVHLAQVGGNSGRVMYSSSRNQWASVITTSTRGIGRASSSSLPRSSSSSSNLYPVRSGAFTARNWGEASTLATSARNKGFHVSVRNRVSGPGYLVVITK